jgi:tetratricopeptide (TPR) repeat protein
MSLKRKTKRKKKTPGPGGTPPKARFMDVQRELEKGLRHHRAGRLKEAEKIYAKILKVNPNLPACLHLRGFVAHQRGKNDEAIEHIGKAIERDPNQAVFHYNLASPYLAQRRLDEAIACYQKALRLNPELIQAHVNLGNVLQEQGRGTEAVHHYSIARELNPDDFLVHLNMANALHGQGKFEEAISCYEQALRLKPDLAEAHYNMGIAYKEKGEIEKALSCYQKALNINRDDFRAYYNMGNAFQEINKLDDAIACYQRAVEIKPENVDAYYHVGNALTNQGRFRDALSWYRKALHVRPDSAEAFYSMAKARKTTRQDADEMFELVRQLKKAELSDDGYTYMNFALGKIYDDLGLYEDAFHHYEKANKRERSAHNFEPESYENFVTRIIDTFNADFFDQKRSWGKDSQAPIFIVGMPRSGTSLVEQIVSSHSQVFGAGELDFFFQLERKFSAEREPATYPEFMGWFDRKAANRVSNDYLELISNLSQSEGEVAHVTDKMPYNFLFLGFLHALFPKARFIHCQRHPLDNGLSIYFQKFAREHHYAYDLDEIGLYYKEYRRLMAHWFEVLSTKIFQINYEDLVCHQEGLSRELIAFCGLEWDSKCLLFHKSDRPVFTSSNWQVRQPMYKSSINRWKNYASFLAPLHKRLAEFV